ncbi:cytochrome c oxidase accessory protein CcoG [Tahibacter amnicola]|uniref:Cytochrome c oxidase accessory protein CcoG n=1 Tax=Tahibacter amnicola TaxID=2976241 RepID=A0ABY6BCX6_9GAMM|nr:cytochrome c oxidase accessory protein CcoG [Tahibacter amnicola]UXI66476.1 cytochrome c oxidase accessory protein CcoG [Tahibacter amnicola]
MKPIPLKLVEPPSQALYVSEAKVYPREIDGRFQRLRTFCVFWLLGMFYLFPWLNLGGRQLVLFDLPARKFHVFGLTFWPQDFYLLALLLIICAVGLFFVTALAGRIWCGYACPQTVWTEVFLWLERWTEGTRNQRMKLDAGPWTRNKVLRKSAKQLLWVSFALWTGFTFVGFFTPIRELAVRVATVDLGGWETFWILFYGFATYGNAGFLREQVCKYMCPYARFQGAMFDTHTLIVSYDSARGEPRGGRRREADLAQLGLGDCIDCNACVQVCPTGIDIRQGLQYECIACAACVDACDSVMQKMDYAPGLIRYTTESGLAGGKARIVRPRTLFYAGLLVVLVSGFAIGVGTRTPVLAELLHDRNALFRETAKGIENSYTVRLVNKTDKDLTLRVSLVDAGPLRLSGSDVVSLAAAETRQLPLTIATAADAVTANRKIHIQFVDDTGQTLAIGRSNFFVPRERRDR